MTHETEPLYPRHAQKDCTRSDWDDERDSLQNSLAIATMESAEKDALIRNLSRSLQAWAEEAFRLDAELSQSKDETEKAKAQRDGFRDELDKVSGALRRASA